MGFTREDQKLADAILHSRPGKNLKERHDNLIRDATRNRKKKLSKYDFLKVPTIVQQNSDIKGFDDGVHSKLANHNEGRKAAIQDEKDQVVKTRKGKAIPVIQPRSTKKGMKNKGTVHQGKRRVHTKEK